MKKTKTAILVLAIVILTGMTRLIAGAETNGVFEIPGNRVNVTFSVSGSTAQAGMTLTRVNGLTSSAWLRIQKLDNGNWTTIKWVYGTGYSLTTSVSVSSGSYRAKAMVYFYDNTGALVDTITKYSAIWTI